MTRSGSGARDDAGHLLELMASLGFDRLTAQVYAVLLTHGPLPAPALQAVFPREEPDLAGSLSRLQDHRLTGVAYEHSRPRYYAAEPALAWESLGTDLLWSGSSEARRRLCAQLATVAGRLHRHHLAALTHREWDALTTEELAQLVCEIVATARRQILAVSKSPRLPHVAAFWTALTSRLALGVRYHRVTDLDEIVAHGLRVVTRDIEEAHIDLRILERDRIRQKFYVVDDKYLAVFHEEGRPNRRGVGRISRKHHTVWRYRQRFSAYEQAAIPADFVVTRLREYAATILSRARQHLSGAEVAWIESLVELGKFSRFHQEAGWPDAELFEVEARASDLGLVRRNIEGELVVAYPLTETDIRAAYLKSRGA
jgi:sugar-specific transcriptional regulator TrmB